MEGHTNKLGCSRAESLSQERTEGAKSFYSEPDGQSVVVDAGLRAEGGETLLKIQHLDHIVPTLAPSTDLRITALGFWPDVWRSQLPRRSGVTRSPALFDCSDRASPAAERARCGLSPGCGSPLSDAGTPLPEGRSPQPRSRPPPALPAV